MCELLGVTARYPATLNSSFGRLIERAKIGNPDGWGAVFYELNDAYHFREPRPGNTSQLAGLLADCGIASKLVVAHIRHATSGQTELRNTHPFTREVQGRLHSFAFNGNVPEVFDQDLALDCYCPIGETDGEFAFCWLLEQLSCQLEADNWHATAAALKAFGNQLGAMGPANFLYSDSLRLYAFATHRYNATGEAVPGLYYYHRQCDQDQQPLSCIGTPAQVQAGAEQSLSLVASVPLSDEDWTPFAENQLLVIQDGVVLQS